MGTTQSGTLGVMLEVERGCGDGCGKQRNKANDLFLSLASARSAERPVSRGRSAGAHHPI